jgi:hypothetical protein
MRAVFRSAESLGVRDRFAIHPASVLDDHVPINRIGIPMIDLIDFEFPHWHTAGDTLDKLDPASFETVGRVVLHLLASERLDP